MTFLRKERKLRILSHSQISTYETCPWQWYASKVLRLPAPSSNPEFAEGRAVHAALASYWLGNANWQEVLKANLDWEFEKVEPQPIPSFSLQTKANILDHIQERDEHLINSLCEAIKKQYKGAVKTIETERKWEIPGFVGVVDWRGMLNGVEHILDWKTSNRPYSEEKVHTDTQLTCYAALTGIRHVGYGVMIKSEGSVQFLTSARTKDECDAYWTKVEQIRKEMDSGVAKPCEGYHCNWCAFANRCPAKGDF